MAKETKPNIKKDQSAVEQTDDLLPKEGEWWRAVKDAGRSIAELHDFYPIQTSPLEQVSSMKICQGVCDEDVEGYGTIKTRKGKMVLRTSWPKAIVRSCIENRLLYFSSPLKVSFCGPVFTGVGEKNFREEWGVEIIGDNDAIYDGYIIMAVVEFLKLVKIKNITLKINSTGCKTCKQNYRTKFKSQTKGLKSDLCKKCNALLEEGSFGVLRCENENCLKVREKVPIILDYLCQNCNHHLRNVLELIEENGVVYDADPALVSDSDCFNKTIFEVYDTASKRLLARGGRHDYLGEQLSKKQLPASGASIILENVIAVMKENHVQIREKAKQKVFFAIVGDQAKKMSMRLMNRLREHGIIAVEAVGKKALKPQLKQAEKLHVDLALIFGQKEAYEGSIIIRDMKSGSQETVVIDNLVEEVKRRLKNL